MLNFVSYRKIVTLNNGRRVLLRLLNGRDWENLRQLFQEVSADDARFLQEDGRDPHQIDLWKELAGRHRIIPLMAEDPESRRLIASAHLHRGRGTGKHLGEIRHILVARPFQNLGLGSLMLEELLQVATTEGLNWLKAEVVLEHRAAVKAFLSKGFQIKVILDDFFMSKDGALYDVALMTRPVPAVKEDRIAAKL